MIYITDWQADVRVKLDGIPFFESWATYQGGDLSAAESKTRPGGMGYEISVPGPASRADQTLTIQWSDLVVAQFNAIEDMIHDGAQALISINWLSRKRVALPGALFARTGSVKGVSDPNYDHQGNATGFMTLVVGSDERRAA